MADPAFKAAPGLYTMVWPDEQVTMRLERLSDGHGTLNAELNVETQPWEQPGICTTRE